VAHTSGIELRRWTRAEYERLAELDLLGPEERLELIDGEILTLPAPNPPHATGVGLVQEALRKAFGPETHVRGQQPIALDEMSEPQPDLAVVRGAIRDYSEAHPELPLLAVEVAHMTVAFDRRRKGSLYARAGLREYWIVNVSSRELEVYRDPVQDSAAPYGWSYRSVTHLRAGESVTRSRLLRPRSRSPTCCRKATDQAASTATQTASSPTAIS
jgi:Uma2 family endonuclease